MRLFRKRFKYFRQVDTSDCGRSTWISGRMKKYFRELLHI